MKNSQRNPKIVLLLLKETKRFLRYQNNINFLTVLIHNSESALVNYDISEFLGEFALSFSFMYYLIFKNKFI